MTIYLFVTHPVQYHVPWFQELAKRHSLTVFFYYQPTPHEQGAGFGKAFTWDVPLLNGYEHAFLNLPKFLNRFFVSSSRLDRMALPDSVILTGWGHFADFQLLNYFKRKNIPVIIRGESNALKPRSFFKKIIHRSFIKKFDAYLAIGEANRRFYLEHGTQPQKIFKAPYFVENERISNQFNNDARLRSQIRRKWNIPEQSFCFLYMGKLEPKKRIMDILKALQTLNSRQGHFLVAGDGELMKNAKDYTAQNNLPVTFAGFVNQTQITQAYAAADCIILPSDYGETWGLVINEAMVCGLPAIVSDRVGCSWDLIQENKTGFTFPFGDVQALSEKMQLMMNEPKKAHEMGENAKGLIQKYSVESTVLATGEAIQFVQKGL